MKKKAFTLVELLVVIAIIGILAGLVTVSLSAARMKARDAKRKADLENIKAALEMYYDDNGKYPYLCGGACGLQRNNRVDSGYKVFQNALKQYITNLPNDPIDNTGYALYNQGAKGLYSYTYIVSNDNQGNKYDLITRLENTSDPESCGKKTWVYASFLPVVDCLHHGNGSVTIDDLGSLYKSN